MNKKTKKIIYIAIITALIFAITVLFLLDTKISQNKISAAKLNKFQTNPNFGG